MRKAMASSSEPDFQKIYLNPTEKKLSGLIIII